MISNRTDYLPQNVGWHNWGDLFTDVDLWRPVVSQICRQIGMTAESVETGYPGSCAVFIVDREVVVKLYPSLFPQDFQKEREVYRLMGERPVHMPRLLAEGVYQDRTDWPYLVLEFRQGKAIREVFPEINADNRLALACELGRSIRIIHDTSLKDSQHFESRPEAWQAFLKRRRMACSNDLAERTSLPGHIVAEVEAFLDTVTLLPSGFETVLLNGDLTADHLLLVQDEGEWRISALIDWADAEAGTPEYEWIALWFGLCSRDVAMFRETLHAYDPELIVDDAFRHRVMALTLLHRFGPEIITHVLQQEDNPSFQNLTELMNWLWPPI